MASMGISFKGNKEQQELVRLIYENNRPIIFCVGKAGTGKTFATLAAALQLKTIEKKYAHIYYVRDSINVGHDIGSLPGTADEKMAPYWGPVYDSLEAIKRVSDCHLNVNDMAEQIEVLPLAFLRGRSFCNAIIVIDEAESYDLNALKTVISRADRGSKVIFLGSYNQVDDGRQRIKDKSDFKRVVEKLQDHPLIGYIELTQSMRAPGTVEIDNLLGELTEEN